MDYKLVFDLQSSDIRLANYLYLLPGIVLFLFGAVTYLFRSYFTSPYRRRPMPRRFPFFMVLFGAVWTQVSAFSLYAQYNYMEHIMKAGKADVVEGKVAHFQPTDFPSYQNEQFCITDTDTCFSYSDYVVTPGFNQTSVHGGPIRNGLPVRVTYKDNTILKLEVAKQPAGYGQFVKQQVPAETLLSPAR